MSFKFYPNDGGFVSNDGFIWTENNPDVQLIEPPILVSCSFNYLQFNRHLNRPPEKRVLRLVNHGDYPIAYKIQTTDNYSYFMDRVCGVIPARRMVCNARVRATNIAEIQIFHRPYSCYQDEEQCKYHNIPRKDKLFILLAPFMCSTFSPTAIFHNERAYEKLRVLLHYTGTLAADNLDKPKQLLLRGIKGWCTWKTDHTTEDMLDLQKLKSVRMMLRTSKEATTCNDVEKTNNAPQLMRPYSVSQQVSSLNSSRAEKLGSSQQAPKLTKKKAEQSIMSRFFDVVTKKKSNDSLNHKSSTTPTV